MIPIEYLKLDVIMRGSLYLKVLNFTLMMLWLSLIMAEESYDIPFNVCDEQPEICEQVIPKNAYEADQDEPDQAEVTKPAKKSAFSFLDPFHESVSNGFESVASSIDGFFANEKVFYSGSGSFLSIATDTLWEEGEDPSVSFDLRVKLKLRRTQEKLKLLFETNPQEPREGTDRVVPVSELDREEDKSLYTGIESELKQKSKWRIKPSIRLRIDFPVDVILRTRVERKFIVPKWTIYFSETPFWQKSIGLGYDTVLEFDHPIGKRYLFRAASFARWTNQLDYYEWSEVLSWSYKISERRGVLYEAGAFGVTEPSRRVNQYLLAIRYRQLLYKDYLFYEVVPSITYDRNNSFRPEYSLLFRVEMVFQRK